MINLNLKLLKDDFEGEFLSSETGEVKEACLNNIFSSGSLCFFFFFNFASCRTFFKLLHLFKNRPIYMCVYICD